MNARIAMCMICNIADSHDLNRILEQENKEEKQNENALYDAETVRRVRTCNQMGRSISPTTRKSAQIIRSKPFRPCSL